MEKTVVEISKINHAKITTEQDTVVCEYPLTIFINGEEFITLLCTPNHLKELTYGILYSEGFITTKDDIKEFFINIEKGTVNVTLNNEINLVKKLQGKRMRTTGCGKGSIFYHTIDSIRARKIQSNLKISSSQILAFSKELNKKSELFLETGGVHTSMLTNEEESIVFFEDVGRHNTVDKIIGYTLLHEIDIQNTILVTSGRISSEMLLKTLKSRIPMIVSRSAPTELAVNIAKEYDLTLVGFVRGGRMNIYHDVNRIECE